MVTGGMIQGNTAALAGGGLYVDGPITVVVTGATFSGNSANGNWFEGGGGAFAVWFGDESVTIRGCTIEGNTSAFGGGIFFGPNGTNVIEDCTIANNTAIEGGGIADFGGPIRVTRCVIENNIASNHTGGLYIHREWDYLPTALVTDTIIRGNSAPHSGGIGGHPAGVTATFERCTIESNTAFASSGGAGRLRYGGRYTIRDCDFIANTGASAGGLWVSDGTSATIEGCRFLDNATPDDGGGLHVQHGASATISNCEFRSNTAGGRGGGIRVGENASAIVRDSSIQLNAAPYGGGIVLHNTTAAVRFEDSDVSANVASTEGGGVHAGCGINAEFIGCAVFDNTAPGGGGFFLDCDPLVRLTGCFVAGNIATSGDGGGLHARDRGRFEAVNSIIVGNTANRGGGAYTYTPGNSFINCTFAGNTARQGGQPGGYALFQSTATLANCILWGNSAPNFGPSSSTVSVSYTDVQGGFAGPGNLNTDPLFTDPLNGDYTLQPASPCIDAADNTALPPGVTTDLAGNPRFIDVPAAPDTGIPGGAGGPAIADMGAYETPAPNCYPDCDPSTGPGVLDIFDFLCFQNRFDAQDPYACDCDISSGPRTCDIFDFLCFQNAYDAGCP